MHMFLHISGCYFSVTKYIELRNESEDPQMKALLKYDPTSNGQERFITEEDFTSQFDMLLKLKNTWLTFAIITGVLLTILLLLVLVLRSRLSIAVALIRQGAK